MMKFEFELDDENGKLFKLVLERADLTLEQFVLLNSFHGRRDIIMDINLANYMAKQVSGEFPWDVGDFSDVYVWEFLKDMPIGADNILKFAATRPIGKFDTFDRDGITTMLRAHFLHNLKMSGEFINKLIETINVY